VDQTSATPPASATAEAHEESQSISNDASAAPPGFGARGRVRRRARFLRRARELAYRDLGGLVFNLHRFGQRNDALVLAKLSTLSHIDSELRALESALAERQPVTVLREAGITACPRCAAIHSSEDRFCPNCGLPLSRRVDLPIAGASAATASPPTPTAVRGAGASPATPPSPGAPATAAPATPTSSPAPPPVAATPGAAPASPAPVPDRRAPTTQAFPAQTPSTQAFPAQTPSTQAFPAQAPSTQAFPAQTPAPASGSDDEPTEIVRPPATGT
jgi:zinc-ribbon domain